MGRGVVGAKWTKRSNVWLLELSGVMTGVYDDYDDQQCMHGCFLLQSIQLSKTNLSATRAFEIKIVGI